MILQIIWLMLPAYFANMAPVFMKKLNFLEYPADFKIKFRKKRLLGKNKTIRGFFFGILIGTLLFYLQKYLYVNGIWTSLALIDYSQHNILGFLLSFGALLGDSVESFFKRQLDVKPGTPFRPWDQLDFVFGALLLSLFVLRLSMIEYIAIIIISPLLHIIVNHIAFYTKVRREKW